MRVFHSCKVDEDIKIIYECLRKICKSFTDLYQFCSKRTWQTTLLILCFCSSRWVCMKTIPLDEGCLTMGHTAIFVIVWSPWRQSQTDILQPAPQFFHVWQQVNNPNGIPVVPQLQKWDHIKRHRRYNHENTFELIYNHSLWLLLILTFVCETLTEHSRRVKYELLKIQAGVQMKACWQDTGDMKSLLAFRCHAQG